MESIIHKIVGRIDGKVYPHKRYYFLHRIQIAMTFSVVFLSLGLIMFLFPVFDHPYFAYSIGGIAIFSLLFVYYRRITQPAGTDYDFLFNKRFYSFTWRLSVGMVAVTIIIASLGVGAIELALTMPFLKITELFLLCLGVLSINSVYMLKSAFKTGIIESLQFWK